MVEFDWSQEIVDDVVDLADCIEWWTKQREAKADQDLKGVMSLTNHTNFLLIPHFPRINLTEWRADQLISIDCILL